MRKYGFLAVLLLGVASMSWADFHPAFQEGEDLTFQIRWGVITGGYATLSIPSIDRVGNEQAYHILSEARSTGMVDTFYRVRDKNEAWLDTSEPRSLRYSKKILEGKYSVDEVVELDQTARTFHETEIRHDKNDAKEEKAAGFLRTFSTCSPASTISARSLWKSANPSPSTCIRATRRSRSW